MKYIKRQIIIEAFKYTVHEMPQWALDRVVTCEITEWEGFLTIEKPEGTMRANPGDYIIKGIADEVYPCNAEIFEQLHDLFIPLDGSENDSPSLSNSL
jgi:hypothetical protein